MVTLWMINKVMETVKESINTEHILANKLDILEANDDELYSLMLPQAGLKGNNFIKSMNNNIQQIPPNNVKNRITYTGRKLGTKFQMKDLTKNQQEHDLIRYSKCLETNYNKDYLSQTERIINERTANHCRKDKQSHILNIG